MKLWTNRGKKKPVDRRDPANCRVTSIKLQDMQGRFVDAKFGDTVCVRCTSSSVAASQEGTIDGFTEHRTRVLIKGRYRYFNDNNLMFLRAADAKKTEALCEVEVAPSITEEDKDKDVITINSDEMEKYFDDLGNYITNYSLAATNLALHLALGREKFESKSCDKFDGQKARIELTNRIDKFTTFITGLKNGVIIEE